MFHCGSLFPGPDAMTRGSVNSSPYLNLLLGDNLAWEITDVLMNPHTRGCRLTERLIGGRGSRPALGSLVFGPITKCAPPVASRESVGLMLAGQRGNVCRRATVPRASTCASSKCPWSSLLDAGGTCLPLLAHRHSWSLNSSSQYNQGLSPPPATRPYNKQVFP